MIAPPWTLPAKFAMSGVIGTVIVSWCLGISVVEPSSGAFQDDGNALAHADAQRALRVAAAPAAVHALRCRSTARR
jgi:hypothetical protein